MELSVVIEALRSLPEGMHVWVSTDSAYVKRGITEWLPGQIKNGWKDAKCASVSNQTLWNALITAVGRMPKVEWSWVKGRGGYLLNECADMLATKGINNDAPYSNVQYLPQIDEDTDTQVYELRDGEETRVGDWNGDTLPACTYVMKDGDNSQECLSREHLRGRAP
jgi:ribonuclease HI